MNTTASSEAANAAQILQKTLKQGKLTALTIADAAARSGLPLRDAEKGLHYLLSEFRGHLSVTQSGELLFHFPTGFSKPWEKLEWFEKLWAKFKKSALGVAKFVVRAWISIVLVAYVAIFAVILIALAFGKNSDRDDNHSSFGNSLLLHTLLRVIFDSLYWTFHPFSPFSIDYNYEGYGRKKDIPFYEKVNRFFFGPEPAPVDPLEINRRILAEIRAKQGRVGIFDIMRVTGLPHKEADPLMARLMLDYDGEVLVSEDGGIVYEFKNIRKTIQPHEMRDVKPIWEERVKMLPLTGNASSSNLFIGALNGFNLLMSSIALTNGWTVERLQWMFTAGAFERKFGFLPPLPEPSLALVLGLIPFCFSLVLFLLPVFRFMMRGKEKKRVARENGRRGLLKAIIARLSREGIDEKTLEDSWKNMAQEKPSDRELVREIVKLGGELEVSESGNARYRFRDLEAEVKALEQQRRAAKHAETEVGSVIFSSAR